MLTNEPNWPEGPVPWGIAIRRNRFLRGGTCRGYADTPQGAALTVRSVRLGHGLAEAEGIRDIVIEDNEFVDRAGTAVFIGGTTDVRLANNRITATEKAEQRRPGSDVLVERSSRVVIRGNVVVDTRPETRSAVEIGAGVAPGEAGVRVENLRASLGPEARPVIDRRD